jgi:hypothetical protein
MAKTIQHADRPICVVGTLITVELPPAPNGGSVRVLHESSCNSA